MKSFKKSSLKLLALCLLLTLLFPSLPAHAAPKVLYNAKITDLFGNSFTGVYEKPDTNSRQISKYDPLTPIQITAVYPRYVAILLSGGKTGYVLRHRILDPIPVDPKATPRFGTALNRFYVTLTKDTDIKEAPNNKSSTLITLHKGAMLGFLEVQDGWAYLIYKRQYGYVDTAKLSELERVSEDEASADADTPLAVYNSFYTNTDDPVIQNRIINLSVGAKRMSVTLKTGQSLNFNEEVGPFRASSGYVPSNALVDGEMNPNVYGGGSCQISSTLYNVVLQLTGLTVLKRAPHSANGIAYLPFGVDASSGDLNFVFRNDYNFPIRIFSHVQDGSLYIAIYKEAQP